jgi:hypothetical protein
VSRACLLPFAVALAACGAEPPCPSADLAPPERTPAFAVLLTDYASSAIALLDERGETITEAWLDSGTRASGISAGIGGDVFLVDELGRGRVALIERFGGDRLTLADLDGAVMQIDLRGDDRAAPGGHSPNPQDAILVGASEVWVSRHNPAIDPRAPELARGNDVIVVDLASGAVTDRIELGADVVVPAPTGEDPDATAIAYARPAYLALLEHPGGARRVIAGLARVSLDFDRTGPGALAVIDPDDRTAVTVLPLPELTGCGALTAIPTDRSRAMVVCTGDSFASEEARRASAGVLRVALDDRGQVAIDAMFRASDHPELPPPTAGLAPLDARRAIVVADPRAEDLSVSRDRLLSIDLEAGSATVVLEASTSFTLGEGTYDLDAAMLLVPDAAARLVHRFADRDGVITALDPIPLPTCRTLPPRQIVRIAR